MCRSQEGRSYSLQLLADACALVRTAIVDALAMHAQSDSLCQALRLGSTANAASQTGPTISQCTRHDLIPERGRSVVLRPDSSNRAELANHASGLSAPRFSAFPQSRRLDQRCRHITAGPLPMRPRFHVNVIGNTKTQAQKRFSR